MVAVAAMVMALRSLPRSAWWIFLSLSPFFLSVVFVCLDECLCGVRKGDGDGGRLVYDFLLLIVSCIQNHTIITSLSCGVKLALKLSLLWWFVRGGQEQMLHGGRGFLVGVVCVLALCFAL